MSNPHPIAEHLHHAVLRMPGLRDLGPIDASNLFTFERQAGRHLEETERLAVWVAPLPEVGNEPRVYLVVEDNEGPQYGVYATRSLAEQHIEEMRAAGSSVALLVEEEPLRSAIDPVVAAAAEVEG